MKIIYKILVIFSLTACSSPVAHLPEFRKADVTTSQSIPAIRGGAYYRIVPYDQISVRFPYHPEQDPKAMVLVQPDGNVNLDAVGTIKAAGLTPDELGKLIVEKVANRLRDPQVAVTIVQYAPRKVFVGGEVNAPGPVLIQEGMTPMQAIFDRGGFKDTAQKRWRRSNSRWRLREPANRPHRFVHVSRKWNTRSHYPSDQRRYLCSDDRHRPRQYLDKAALKRNPPHGIDRFWRHGHRIVTATVIRGFIPPNYSEWLTTGLR